MIDPATLMSLSSMFGGGAGAFGPGSLALGIGGSLLGAGLSKRSARKQKHSMAKRLRAATSLTQSIQGRALQQQEALTRQATGQQLAGYDTARREAARLGRGSKRRALEREQQLGGSLSQGLQNRGLGSTTVGANLSRGLASDTSRVMADIDEGLAGMFGDLALGRAGTEAAGTQALGNIAAQRGNLLSSLGQMNLLGGQQLGQFQAPMSSGPGTLEMALPGIMGALGQYQSSQQNQMDPRMIQWLFGMGAGGYNPNAGAGMNLNTFVGSGSN